MGLPRGGQEFKPLVIYKLQGMGIPHSICRALRRPSPDPSSLDHTSDFLSDTWFCTISYKSHLRNCAVPRHAWGAPTLPSSLWLKCYLLKELSLSLTSSLKQQPPYSLSPYLGLSFIISPSCTAHAFIYLLTPEQQQDGFLYCSLPQLQCQTPNRCAMKLNE